MIIRTHSRKLFAIAYGILQSREEAEDVVQDALVKAWKTRWRVRDPEKFPAWLATIARHRARELLGDAARFRCRTIDDSDRAEVRLLRPNSWTSINKCVPRWLRLPELHRAALTLRYFEEMDYAHYRTTFSGLNNGALRGILGRALASCANNFNPLSLHWINIMATIHERDRQLARRRYPRRALRATNAARFTPISSNARRAARPIRKNKVMNKILNETLATRNPIRPSNNECVSAFSQSRSATNRTRSVACRSDAPARHPDHRRRGHPARAGPDGRMITGEDAAVRGEDPAPRRRTVSASTESTIPGRQLACADRCD